MQAQPEFPGFILREKLRVTRVGVWFRAEQHRIGREVLLKVPVRGDKRALRELQREVRILGRLQHGSLITLFDFQPQGDLPFAVYELPGSRTLDAVVGQGGGSGALELVQVLDKAIGIAELLTFLHRHGLRLRQAAPDDFWVDEAGSVRLANLEAMEPEGVPEGELSPLWRAPRGSGTRGDLVLLGLHLIYLSTGARPVPETALNDRGRYVESVRQALEAPAGTPGGVGGQAVAAIVNHLLDLAGAGTSLEAPAVLEHLRELAAGQSPVNRRRRRVAALALLTVPALLAGLALGSWFWHREGAEPIPEGPAVSEDAVTVADSAAADSQPGEPGVDPAPGTVAPAPTPGSVGPLSPGDGTATTAPAGSADAAPVVAISDVASGAPPAGDEVLPAGSHGLDLPRQSDGTGTEEIVGETTVSPPSAGDTQGAARAPGDAEPPGPVPEVERFVSALVAAQDGLPTATLDSLTATWRRGIELLAAAYAESAPTDPPMAAGEAAVSPATRERRQALVDSLVLVRTEIEVRRLRNQPFAVSSAQVEGDTFTVEYDFSKQTQLDDWEAVGADARLSVLDGRLLIHGGARFRPTLALRAGLRVLWRVPMEDVPRANINLVLGFVREATAEESSAIGGVEIADVLLCGIGTDVGVGVLSSQDDPSASVILPATVVLSASAQLLHDFHRPESIPFSLLWHERSARRQVPWLRAEEFEFSWVEGEIAWRAGDGDDGDVLRRAPRERIAAALDALSGDRLLVGFRPFASVLVLDYVLIEGRIDTEWLRSRARDLAVSGLRDEVPQLRNLVRDQP